MRAPERPPGTVLVAGVGNVLRGDDGFGVVVAERLAARPCPPWLQVVETGIGGIHLVQEIMAGADALIVVDAADRGRPPGTVMVIEPDILDVASLGLTERHDLLADMHLARPDKALMLAAALGVLPPRVRVVGCQPVDVDTVGTGLSGPVEAAIDTAVAEVLALAGLLRAAAARPAC